MALLCAVSAYPAVSCSVPSVCSEPCWRPIFSKNTAHLRHANAGNRLLEPHPSSEAFVRKTPPLALMKAYAPQVSFGRIKPSPELDRLLGPSGFFCDGSGLSHTEKAALIEDKTMPPVEAEFRKHFKTVLDLFISYIQDKANKTGKRLPVVVTLDENHKHQKLFPEVIKHLRDSGIDVCVARTASGKTYSFPLGMLGFMVKHFRRMNGKQDSVAGGLMLTSGKHSESFMGLRFLDSEGKQLELSPKKKIYPLSRLNKTGELVQLKYEVLEILYNEHIASLVNMQKIGTANLFIFHDAREGASKETFLCSIHGHVGNYDLFDKIRQHLPMKERGSLDDKEQHQFSNYVKKWANLVSIGLINNSDASLTRVVDENGKLLTPSDVTLLLVHHLKANKQHYGVLCKASNLSASVDELAATYGVPSVTVPSDFQPPNTALANGEKELFLGTDGEGGFWVKGHPKIRDGLLTNILLAELMAYSKEPLSKTLKRIKSNLGKTYTHRKYVLEVKNPEAVWAYIDKLVKWGKHFNRTEKLQINVKATQNWMQLMKAKAPQLDEVKLYFNGGSSILLKKQNHKPNEIELVVDFAYKGESATKKENIRMQEAYKRFFDNFHDTLSFKFPEQVGELTPKFDEEAEMAI